MALKGIKVIEMAGLAPAPFCGMILKDFGAQVVRIDKTESFIKDLLTRGKISLKVDLKSPLGVNLVEKMCSKADVLIDPFRAGVMERLGLGPEKLLKQNQRLIYARLTGYGQDGPLSKTSGHDINYLAISGVLSLLGPPKPGNPIPPINLLADFGGGGLICALGICMALIERSNSGLGQVIDANMVEGVRYLSSFLHFTRNDKSLQGSVIWPNKTEKGKNLLDGGAPFYSVYETKDEKHMAIGALEPKFFYELVRKLGIDENKYVPGAIDEKMRSEMAAIFKTKTQDQWSEIFKDSDACVSPIVDFDRANEFYHNKARNAFCPDGSPIPAPRLSRTPAKPGEIPENIANLDDFLASYSIDPQEIAEIMEKNIVQVSNSFESKL